MIILSLVATVTAGMVWYQTRAVQVEAAERARAQAAWILSGALDWARLILREDLRTNQGRAAPYDSLDEVWATPLAEARLSSFLAADKNNNADGGPEAFISGAITDAQSRFNLRGVVGEDGKVIPVQLAALKRLVCPTMPQKALPRAWPKPSNRRVLMAPQARRPRRCGPLVWPTWPGWVSTKLCSSNCNPGPTCCPPLQRST
jgi:general secretion pathway protein K